LWGPQARAAPVVSQASRWPAVSGAAAGVGGACRRPGRSGWQAGEGNLIDYVKYSVLYME